jgi:mandelate racemase
VQYVNQGLHLGEALERCHAIDDLGLAWIEEPIVYDTLDGYARLTAHLKTPVKNRREFLWAHALYTAGGAGTFDGIVLSGIVAANLA